MIKLTMHKITRIARLFLDLYDNLKRILKIWKGAVARSSVFMRVGKTCRLVN